MMSTPLFSEYMKAPARADDAAAATTQRARTSPDVNRRSRIVSLRHPPQSRTVGERTQAAVGALEVLDLRHVRIRPGVRPCAAPDDGAGAAVGAHGHFGDRRIGRF